MPTERAIMAVAEHLCAQPAAGGGAEAIRSTLSAAIEEAATHQKRPALRCVCRVGDGRAAPIDEPAQRGRSAAKEWPEDWIESKLRRQALYERRREEEAVRRDRRRRSLRGPGAQREFRAGESDGHTSTQGG